MDMTAARAATQRNPNAQTVETLRKGKRINVQLDRDVAEGVLSVARRERRSISSAINALAAEALDARATGDGRVVGDDARATGDGRFEDARAAAPRPPDAPRAEEAIRRAG